MDIAKEQVPVNIEDEIKRSYLDYAMSVIMGRAVPDVRDGLKPVHRRILYAMLREGLTPDRKFSKCAGVVGEVLKKYDRPTTLAYLDPPYFGRKLYNFNFDEADFVELAKRLGGLHGKFVLSLNDVPEVRQIFRQFHFREIELAYTAQPNAGKRFRELLITNFRIAQSLPRQSNETSS